MAGFIVVEGATVTITSGLGSAEIKSSADCNCKINDKGIYIGDIEVSIDGYSGSGFTDGNGSGNISANSSALFKGDKVTLIGATATFNVTAMTTSTPPTTTSVPCTVVITDAGQSDVQCD